MWLVKVFLESKVTPRFLTVGRRDRISKKLSREFVDETLSGLFVSNDNEFSFLGVEFKFHSSHPVLDTCKTLSKLRKNGVKVPMVQC